MNRFARPISKEEFEKMTASTESKSSVLSAGLRDRAMRQNDERLAFNKRMEELAALPQVAEFQNFLSQLQPAEAFELLEKIRNGRSR